MTWKYVLSAKLGAATVVDYGIQILNFRLLMMNYDVD